MAFPLRRGWIGVQPMSRSVAMFAPKPPWLYGPPNPWFTPQKIATSGATSVTLDFTQATVGEWCFAIVGLTDVQAATPAAPSGWTILVQGGEGTTGAASSRLICYTRRKQAGDTTQAFTWGTACGYAAIGAQYPGLDPTTPTEGAIYLAHASGTTYPTGSITPTAANRWIVGAFYNRTTTSSGTWTPDAAMAERVEVASAANPWSLLEIADTNSAVTQAGHTYTSTSTVTSSHGGSIAFALVPATVVAGTGAVPLLVAPASNRTPAGAVSVVASQSDPAAAPAGTPPAALVVPGPRVPPAGSTLHVASRVDLSAPTDPQPAPITVAGYPPARAGTALVIASRVDVAATPATSTVPVLSAPAAAARPAPAPLVVASRADIPAPTDAPPRPVVAAAPVPARTGAVTVVSPTAGPLPVTDTPTVPTLVAAVRRTGTGLTLVSSSQAPSPDTQPAPLTSFPAPTTRPAGSTVVAGSRADVPVAADSPTMATVVGGVRRTGPGAVTVVSPVSPSPDVQPSPVVRPAGIGPLRTGVALVTRIVADLPPAYPAGFTASGPGRWPARAGMALVAGSLPPPTVLPATLAPVTVTAYMPRYRMAAPPVLVRSWSDFVVCETPRPSSGTTTRPSSGMTVYSAAMTARPSSGTTARPNTGETSPPC